MRLNYYTKQGKIDNFTIELTEPMLPCLHKRDDHYFANHFVDGKELTNNILKHCIEFDIKWFLTHKKNYVDGYTELNGFTKNFLDQVAKYNITSENILEIKKNVEGFKKYEVQEDGIVKVIICT